MKSHFYTRVLSFLFLSILFFSAQETYAQPAAPTVTSPVTYCKDATASALTATGTSLLWYTTATGGTGSAIAPVPSTATAGTTNYYVTQSDTSGESARALIAVVVNSLPSAPTVIPSIDYCQGYTSSALSATGTGLLWYTTATGGTGSATAPTPSTATAGTTYYYVTQTNATTGCESPRSSIEINVLATPSSPAVTTPVNYCIGATSVALTATGTSLLWYTTATGGTGTSTAPIPSTATLGTTNYYVTQTAIISGCESPRSLIVVNVNPLPAAPTVTTPVTYCVGATAIPLTATGTSLRWYTTATGGVGSATAPTPSTATAGTTDYYVSQINVFGCEGPRALISVVVNALPAAPTVTTPVTYCVGATASALTATGTGLLWYTVATGGTGSATAPTPSTASAGTTNYYVTQTNATTGCESPRALIAVVVNALPAAPTVTSPVNYCVGVTASALTATGTGLLWYTVATGGTGSAIAPTPSTATAGTTNYYVSQTNATTGCEGPRALIAVVVNALPAAPTVTTPITYCQDATASALTATGTGLLWYTTATGGTGSATAPTPSTATAGTTNYYVSQTNATTGCEGPRALIAVVVNALPAAPTVTTPVNYCIGATATALTATGTGLLWYTTATGGTGSATAPTPSTATAGITNYYVTQTNATTGCESPRALIAVVINASPAAPTVVSPVSYCRGEVASPLTATGTGLLWYTVPTGGTGSATAPTPSTAIIGPTDYYVSQTSGFGCESARATITVNIRALPVAPTVTTPVTYCQGATASPLTATGTGLLWYTTATGGTGSATAPTPSTATAGTTNYYVSQTSASTSCEGPRSLIAVVVNALPAAPTVTTPVTYCVGATASALTATGTGLLWYTTATGGAGSATAPTPSTATAGTTNYYVSQTNATTGCESPRALIAVVVNALPAAPTVTTPVTYCVGATASALTATGTGLLWYTVATGGTGSATAPTPSTATAGTTNYYVSQTNATTGCEGPRALIAVVVNALPAAPTVTTPVTYCVGATASALTATGTGLLWYTVATGGTGSATAPTPSTATAGTTNYYVSQTNATTGCEGPRALIAVVVNALPAAPTVSTPVTYCVGATASALTATGTGLLWYTVATGGTGSATAPTPSTATAGTTNYYVSQTNATTGCESPRALIAVVVNALPAAPTVTTPVTYCQGVTASALTATGTGLLWYTGSTGGTGSATAPTPSTATAGTTNYYVSQTNATTGCESPRALIAVVVNALPAAPTVSTPVTYCVGATASALTATGTGLLWYTVPTGGTGSATAPIPSTATAGTTNYYVTQTNATTGCESPRSLIAVEVNPLPAAPTVTTPVTYCVGATATALTATGTGLLWYTVATGGTGSATAPTPSTATAGTTNYYVSQTSGLSCEGPRALIAVVVNALPAAPTVTTPVTYCEGATASPLTASGIGLLWYTVATGGTGSATAPTPSTATAGTTNYYVSQTNTITGCEGPRALIAVVVNALPAAPTVTSPVTYCVGATASALTATGTGLLWYTVATGGTGSATAPTPSTATAGTTNYYVSQTNATTGCEGPRALIAVVVNALPAAPTVTTPVTYCVGATASALTATGTGLLWYTAATGGTGSSSAPIPSTATAGITNYYVSQTNATTGCEGPRALIAVVVNPLPAAPTVTTPVTYCQGATASALTATGTGLLWYTVATGGTGAATAPTPSTATAGTTNYYVSQTNATTGCEGPRALIAVVVNALPAAPTVTSPVTYCVGATASALTATGTGLLWYTVATGGTGSTTAPTPSTATAGTTNYYVSQTNATTGCEGPRALIAVEVNPLPTISGTLGVCFGSSTTLTGSGTPHPTTPWTSSATGVATVSSTGVVTAVATGTTTITYTNSNGCSTTATVTVNPLPTITITVAETSGLFPNDKILCDGGGATMTATGGTSYQWWYAGGMYSTSPVWGVGFGGVGGFLLQVKVTNSFGCIDSAFVTITTTPRPTAITGTLSACIGGTSALASTGTPHPTTPWTSSAPGVATVSSTGVVTAVAAGTTTISYINDNNCSASATFTVNPDPTISGTLNTCLFTTRTLTGSGTPHPTTPWTSSAPGVATISSTGVVTGVSAGTTTITYMNSNGCTKSATFTVNPLPTISHTTAETSGLAANDAIVCHGAFAALTASGGGTYEWWYAGSVYTTSPTISGGFAGPGTVVFKLVVTSTSGCVDSTFPSVLVHAPLSISGTLSSCIGGSTTLTGSGPDHTTTPWTSSSPSVATISSTGVVNALAAGTTTITYQNSNNCTITATYTVNPDPTISGTLSACIGNSSTLTGSGTPHPTTPWSSSATGVATVSSTGVVTGVSAGTTTITYMNNNGCIKTATFTVNPLPTSISGTLSACVGATSTLTGAGTPHPTTPWTSSVPGVATVSGSGVVTGILAGTTTITYMNSNGCTISATFTVNPLPATPTVTTPVDYCVGATASALTATGTSLKWYSVPTGGTGSTTAPTPSTALAGSINYYVSQTNGFTCEGPRAVITVNINPLPAAPTVTTPVTYCQGATASALTATGAGLLWYTVATGGTGSATAPTPSTAAAGTTNYYVSQTNLGTGCEGPRTLIAVVVNPLPAAPTVTTPVTYCEGATASALTATGTGLLWYTVATGGTGSATAPTPSTATAGTTNYYVSQTNATTGCEGPRALIAVVVNALPAAPTVTTPVNYCLGATASALTATGTSLKWYTVATGGTGSATAPTPSTATAGTTNYYVSQTNTTTGCEGPRALIAVVVNALPVAPTVTTPVNYCQGATATALTATGTGLLWYTVATGGTGTATAPTPSTSTVGTTNYYVSQTSATTGCEGSRALIAVVVNALPAAPTVTTPVTYCAGATASALTATGTGLKWYTVATGGTGSATAPTPSTATAGTTNYYVSQTNTTTGCEGSRSLIAVVVNALPAAPTVTTPVTYCQNATASALTATGTSLKWYTVATGGTGSTTAPTPSTATAGTFNYYVSQTNGTTGCESPRALIAVVINPLPTAPTVTTPVNYCQGATSTALTATGTSLLWYTAATGGTGSATAPTPSTATVGSTNYYVSQTTALGCEGSRALIVVSINPIPVAPTVTTPINLCRGITASALTATGTNLKWYTVATGGTGSSTAPVPSTTALGTTNYYVSQTSTFGCEGPRSLIVVTVNPLPIVTITSMSPYGFFYCKGLKVTLKANSTTAKLYNWDFAGTPIATAISDTLSVGVTGTWGVTVKDTFGCPARATVFVSEAPASEKAVLTPTKAQICEEGSVLLTCNPGFVSYTYQWFKDGLPILPLTPKDNLKNATLPGTYIVYVMNDYGCYDTTNVTVVTNYPKPIKPVITNTAPLLQIPAIYTYYQWYKNGAIIVGANSYQLLTTTGGLYHVQVTDENGCLNYSDTVTILGSNGIKNTVSQDVLKIYPNPTRSIVNIDAPVRVDVEVTDVTGRQIYSGKDVKSVNMENVADGTYIFRIFDENHQLITVQKINKLSN
jgi:hypothetical protein